jgi:hypothetical protein
MCHRSIPIIAAVESLLALTLPQQLRQPRDLMAIRRASSFVRTLACRASASLSRL